MAKGDAYVGGPTSVASGSFLDVQPSSGVEAVIRNLFLPKVTGGYELHWYDGTTSEPVDVLDGTMYNTEFHVNSTRRIRVKNISGSAKNLGYGGVQTK